MIKVAMVNRASVLTDHTASITVPVFQEWLDDVLIPAWGLEPVTCVYVARHEKVPRGTWPLYLLDTSDVPGAGGYHEDTGKVPDGKVFVKDALKYGISWTVDFSHELGEMLVDPTTDRWVPLTGMPGWSYIVEIGDPVEDDRFGFKINGVLMTDFILPKYANLPSPASLPASMIGSFDWQGHIHSPVPALLPGGYLSIRSPTGHIRQLTARLLDGSTSRRAARISRVYRS